MYYVFKTQQCRLFSQRSIFQTQGTITQMSGPFVIFISSWMLPLGFLKLPGPPYVDKINTTDGDTMTRMHARVWRCALGVPLPKCRGRCDARRTAKLYVAPRCIRVRFPNSWPRVAVAPPSHTGVISPSPVVGITVRLKV